MAKRAVLLVVLFLSVSVLHAQQQVNIVTWNVREAFTPSMITARSSDMRSLAFQLQPDILLHQEIDSIAVVEEIRDQMGLTGFHIACTDFNHNEKCMVSDEIGFEQGRLSECELIWTNR